MGESKRRCLEHQATPQGGEDRISELPVDILLRILSLLETKQSVQTSRLSKGWRNLWASVPELDFHSQSFKSLRSCKKFVSRVLSLRGRDNVSRLRFVYEGLDRKLTRRVIKYAISHHVNHLHLAVSGPANRDSQVLKISSPDLRSLTLHAHCGFEISAPNLTVLDYNSNGLDIPFTCNLLPLMNLPRLQHAKIDLYYRHFHHFRELWPTHELLAFFQTLSTVQSLTLSYATIQRLEQVGGLHQPSPFVGLKNLFCPCSFNQIPDHVLAYLDCDDESKFIRIPNSEFEGKNYFWVDEHL